MLNRDTKRTKIEKASNTHLQSLMGWWMGENIAWRCLNEACVNAEKVHFYSTDRTSDTVYVRRRRVTYIELLFFCFFLSLSSFLCFHSPEEIGGQKRALPWSSATRSTVHFNPFWALVSQHKRIINRMNTTKERTLLCSILTALSFHWLQCCCSM